ncbi:MAG: flagellar assembly peptidoglycan hydrolase FlgJ [Steroidobacteraceae bacterium]
MAIPVTDPTVYADFAGLDQLKRAARANDPQALRAVAKQFESLFARMMIKSMRDAIGPDPLFGSDQEQMYQGMFDDQLSVDLTRGRGLGLADMLIRQLQRTGAPSSGDPAGASRKDLSDDRLPAARRSERAFSLRQRALPLRATSKGQASPPSRHAPASGATRARFIRNVWPHAAQAARALGVSPASVIAQAALETNWGQNVPRDAAGRSSHNLFGIKAGEAWSGADVSAETHEFTRGAPHATAAAFRSYGSPAQSFDDYVALLRGDPRYAAALGTGNDVQAFATALQRGGYATDPDYAHKVMAVAASLADIEPPVAPAAAPPASGELKLADAQPITVRSSTL